MMNREKIIRTTTTYTETGYISDNGEFILHSFDDEQALIFNIGTWYKDGLRHRDNHKPVRISSGSGVDFFKNGEEYWYINNEEYYVMNEIKEKFKNNILKLKNINMKILKDTGIDAIWIDWSR